MTAESDKPVHIVAGAKEYIFKSSIKFRERTIKQIGMVAINVGFTTDLANQACAVPRFKMFCPDDYINGIYFEG